MKRITVLGVFILMALSLAHLLAQDKKKKKGKDKEPVPVYNYVVDDPMDAFGPKGDATDAVRYFIFPEFYTHWPVEKNDTIYKYDCFDINHNPIIADTLHDVNDIQYISLVKTHNDYLRTYIDAEGKPRPFPVSQTLYKYERTGTDTWKSLDMIHNYSSTLQEHKDKIVRRDTTFVVNRITGNKQTTIRQYYKVTEIDGSQVANAEKLPTENGDLSGKSGVTTFYFTVPEFYFHWRKKSRDTTYEFLCYDDRDTLIPFVHNFDSVRYYSLFKSFIDSTNTYRGNDGKKKPLPVSTIVKRYDRTSKDKWISVEYPSNKFTDLKGFRDVIVFIDTEAIADPVTETEVQYIYKHFKVIKN